MQLCQASPAALTAWGSMGDPAAVIQEPPSSWQRRLGCDGLLQLPVRAMHKMVWLSSAVSCCCCAACCCVQEPELLETLYVTQQMHIEAADLALELALRSLAASIASGGSLQPSPSAASGSASRGDDASLNKCISGLQEASQKYAQVSGCWLRQLFYCLLDGLGGWRVRRGLPVVIRQQAEEACLCSWDDACHWLGHPGSQKCTWS